MRRLCEHLGIAFAADQVYPGIVDFQGGAGRSSDIEELNAIGRSFGIRFREMTGTMSDLIDTVSDSGPALVQITNDDESEAEAADYLMVLEAPKRGFLKVYHRSADKKVPIRWVKKRIQRSRQSGRDPREVRWLLVQPMLAAGTASRFHYQTGTMKEPLKPLKRLVEFLRPEAQDIRTILIFSLVVGILSLSTPLAVEAIVNTIAFGRYLQPLVVLSFIVLVFLAFRAALNVLMTIVAEIIQRKMFVRTVEDLSYRLTRVPLSVWKKYHGPELVNRFFDIVSLQKITSKLLLDSLSLFLNTVIGLTVLAFYHPFLLGYDIGLLAMMAITLNVIGRGAIKTAKEESQQKYETAAWLQEIVRHPTTFKYNGGLGFAIGRADELAARYIHSRQSHFKILIRQISFAMVMQVIAATVLLALGGYLVIIGEITLGQLVAAELIVTVILGSFAKLGKDLESFYDLMASVDKLGKLFDLPIERIDQLTLTRGLGAWELTLSDYQLDEKNTAPASIDFTAGQTYTIYGSDELRRGKFMETVIGQGRPKSGHVLLQNFRIDAISAQSLQAGISYVNDIELFEGTIDDNIRMGREGIGSHDVSEIVRKLGLRKAIANLPEGLMTRLQICGYPLSQEQAIRLMLARSLIARPGVLFVEGLLDRLADADIAPVLTQLQLFSNETTIVIATGRDAIIRWGDRHLNIDMPLLELESFND